MIEVWILHPATGQPLSLIDRYTFLEYTKVTSAPGAFSMQLPVGFDMSLVQPDTRVVIWRQPSGGTKTIDFCGLVRFIQKETNRGRLYTIGGPDLNDLLDTRIIAYAAQTAYSEKSDQADDMMKALVRENLGALATTAARNLTSYGFTVQADVGLGTSVTKGCAWQRLLATLQKIGDDSHSTESTAAYFGIVPLNVGWECEFRTNVGQWGLDHRYPSGPAGVRIFGLEYGNLIDMTRATDYRAELNYAYAGGQGEGSDRIIAQASDSTRIGVSPFNRRETFVDARNFKDAANIQDAADGAVRNGRPRNSFAAKLVDTQGYLYGRDYGFGDYVTAVDAGETVDVRIESVRVRMEAGRETVEAWVRKES